MTLCRNTHDRWWCQRPSWNGYDLHKRLSANGASLRMRVPSFTAVSLPIEKFRGLNRRLAQDLTAYGKFRSPAVMIKTIGSHTDRIPGRHMLQETTQKMLLRQRHERDLLTTVMKFDLVWVTSNDTLVGDGTSPKITSQIGQHANPVGIGLLQINIPWFSAQLVEKISEVMRLHPLR